MTLTHSDFLPLFSLLTKCHTFSFNLFIPFPHMQTLETHTHPWMAYTTKCSKQFLVTDLFVNPFWIAIRIILYKRLFIYEYMFRMISLAHAFCTCIYICTTRDNSFMLVRVSDGVNPNKRARSHTRTHTAEEPKRVRGKNNRTHYFHTLKESLSL